MRVLRGTDADLIPMIDLRLAHPPERDGTFLAAWDRGEIIDSPGWQARKRDERIAAEVEASMEASRLRREIYADLAQAERERRLRDLEEKVKRGEYTGEPEPAPEPVVVDPFGRAVELCDYGHPTPFMVGGTSGYWGATGMAHYSHPTNAPGGYLRRRRHRPGGATAVL